LKSSKKVNNLLNLGCIQQNKSPYGAPILFINKKNDKLKMCIDYHTLNKITIKNNYLLPSIDNVLNQFNGVKYFSQIDLKSRYYQIHIANEDVEETSTRTKYSSYEFLIMPFKWCNVPSMFITFMNLIF